MSESDMGIDTYEYLKSREEHVKLQGTIVEIALWSIAMNLARVIVPVAPSKKIEQND